VKYSGSGTLSLFPEPRSFKLDQTVALTLSGKTRYGEGEMSAPNERRSIARILAACLIAVCGFFAGDGGAQAQGLRKIRIGSTTPSITTLPTEMAAKAGFFKEVGLEPEMITIRSADIIVKALMTGDLDYSTALPSLVAAGVRGLPIRVFSVMIAKTTYVMVSQRGIESVKDLKGKTIAVSSFGAASDYVVRVALTKAGLDAKKDVTILQVGGSSARLGALQAGLVQATVLVAPFNLQAERMGYRTLLWLGDVVDLPQGGLGANEKRLRESPDEVVRVAKATARGIHFIKTRKEETVKFMMSWLNLDRTVADGIYPLVRDSLVDFGIVDDGAIQSAVEATKFQFRIDKDVPLDQIRDARFAAQARDQLIKEGMVK
jgi:ABC-type nitrate/sulfonate/bicarbonate transport system substrate-binding protein